MKVGDISVIVAVIAIVVMMVIPLPTAMLDVMLAFNITIALTVLLVTMYTKEPLEFSVFPSLLLLLTLFRLALNVSSTRLILLQANAGEIIEAFGNFVAGNELIVGFVIFLILVVIQFVVITKGAERVAEVAARFTLDAMPGKQMSIDADLNAGLLTEGEARARRQKIQMEADFYGSMDGASKFVKGDAIAGIVITLINIVGGIVIGAWRQGLPLGEALETYALLSIGDGLVSQIPALLISTATGIIVTRAASDNNLGSDVIAQVLAQPKILIVTGFALFFFALVPGLPTVPFLVLATLTLLLAWRWRNALTDLPATDEEAIALAGPESSEPENVAALLAVDPLEIELGFGLIGLADVEHGSELSERITMIRRQFALELGFVVPVIRIRDNIQLKPNVYVIKVKGVPVSEGELFVDHLLAMNPGSAVDEIAGISAIEPAFGLPAWWIKESERERAELKGYTVVDPATVLATHLTETIRQHAHELLSRQEVRQLLDNLRETVPAVVEDVTAGNVTVGQIQKVLANLLREGVPIRDLVTILEAIADNATAARDTDLLTEYARQALSRVISRQYAEDGQTLQVLTLDPNLEQLLLDSVQRSEGGSYLNLDPEALQRLYHSLSREMERLASRGQSTVVLTAPVVRLYFRRLAERMFSRLTVISYNELDPTLEVQAVGMVKID